MNTGGDGRLLAVTLLGTELLAVLRKVDEHTIVDIAGRGRERHT